MKLGKKANTRISNVIITVFLAWVAIAMIYPLIWMVSTSLKETNMIFEIPPKLIPEKVNFSAYIDIWSEIPLLSGIKNSLFIAVVTIPFSMFSSSIAAFAFSKLRFPFRDQIFFVVLATIMIPFPVTMIPQYMYFAKLGWIDTFLPLIVPALFGNIGVMFFLMQYLKGIPNALIESAKIDGASFFCIYRKIIVPLIKPALAAQGIFMFMGSWNDLMGPIIYLNDPQKLTIQPIIATLNSFYSTQNNYPMIMAGGVIAIVPLLIVFVVFQKQIIDSLMVGSIKG